jgi:hypothetical protein
MVFNCNQVCIHVTPVFFQDQLLVGWDSVVSIATHYEPEGPGIENWWRQGFPRLSRPTLGPTQPLVQ